MNQENQKIELQKRLKHYRISVAEYEMIKSLLGREPKPIEWPLFSALWSEHCSYKSSRMHLKKFGKTLNASVLNAAGENAGVVDLGYDERIVFKMESHNHPSFIEPYQGAATGVGGILRDIFTMGARPIALADYLCFGEISVTPIGLQETPIGLQKSTAGSETSTTGNRMGFLVDGVVRGIGGYGNSVGVPTVTGQTNFDKSYDKNILVNAMAVGLLRPGEKVALSAAKGPGNLVVYVGAKTGKDGVHGAAMASESFDENSEAKKPNVQIGDPYFEKLLIESCLEVLKKDLVVSIQDMGAAGLTSSSFEMASKGNVGMSLKLDQVPIRDSSIQPEEILLSESQERMLLICEPKKIQVLQSEFEKWGLDAVVVGEVLQERKIELWWKGELLTSIDPYPLVENAPMYDRTFRAWTAKNKVIDKSQLQNEDISKKKYTEKLFGHVQFTSRKNIYRQYDQRVGLNTVRGADHDVAILRLPDSGRALGVAVGCRPHLMKMDARIGAQDAVYYPALQLALRGIKVVALTDCLNFGNPERPEIMSEFVASVDAITESSLKLKAPVISGNVSFYNETLGENIISTPAMGLVGLGPEDASFINGGQIPQDVFQHSGNSVYLVSSAKVFIGEISKSQFQYFGEPDLNAWTELVDAFTALTRKVEISASQMVGRGGLGWTLAQMSLGNYGYKGAFAISSNELWQETLYQAVFEVNETESKKFEIFFQNNKIEFKKIGEVQADILALNDGTSFNLKECKKSYELGLRGSIENLA